MQAWHTLLELKDNHNRLGFKGWTFFIVDFPIDVETGEMFYMIGNPTFTGLGVTTGTSSYILNKKQVNELFNVMGKTFKEYAKELEDEYFGRV